MPRYAIFIVAILISVSVVKAAEIDNSKIFYEKYLTDGRAVKIMKNSSFIKIPGSKKGVLVKEWPADLPVEWKDSTRIYVAPRNDYWLDKYTMVITDGKTGSITVWEKEIEREMLQKGEPTFEFDDFKVHDLLQVKKNKLAVLFSENETFLEIIGMDSDGVCKMLFSKSLARQSPSSPNCIIEGQLLWFDNAMYVIARTLAEETVFWIFKYNSVKKGIFSRISGPFSFYRIIEDKEKNTAGTD